MELAGADSGPGHWPPGPSCPQPSDQDSAGCAHRDPVTAGSTLRDRAVRPFRLRWICFCRSLQRSPPLSWAAPTGLPEGGEEGARGGAQGAGFEGRLGVCRRQSRCKPGQRAFPELNSMCSFSFMRLWLGRSLAPQARVSCPRVGNLRQPDQILRLLPPWRVRADEAAQVRFAEGRRVPACPLPPTPAWWPHPGSALPRGAAGLGHRSGGTAAGVGRWACSNHCHLPLSAPTREVKGLVQGHRATRVEPG